MAKRRHRLEEESILSGQGTASPRDIIRLIHAINPTDRMLTAAERQERYEKKARLQSRLIRDFGEHLDVEPDPRDPDVVSLFLRIGRKDAAHARLSALDEDARRWARHRLDVLAEEEPEHRVPAWTGGDAPSAGTDLLMEGRAALDEYDYEEARRCFEAALTQPRQALEAGKALLEVLVDSLALDEEALALEPRLPRAVRDDPACRSRLGLAAARLGRVAEARTFLDGAAGAVEAWEALARDAIQRRDHREAIDCIRRVQQQDPAHPAVLPLSEQVERLRALAWQPAEEALRRRMEAREWETVESEAEALLRQWPQSTVARQALGAVDAHRQTLRRDALLRQADAAEADGRIETARNLLKQAAEAGAAVGERVQTLQQRVQQDQEQRQVQDVLAALTRDHRAGLLAAAALSDRLLLPLVAQHPALQPLVELGNPRGSAEVDAVLALEQAQRMVGAGDFSRAEALLSAHEGVLRRLPGARRLRKEAHARVQERSDAALAELLAEAEAELDAGAAGSALARLQGADTVGRDPRLVQQRDALRKRAEEARRRQQAQDRYQALLAAGDSLGARDWAMQQEEEEWEARRREAQRRVEADWRLTVMDGPFSDQSLLEHQFARYVRNPHIWLREGGEELFLVDTWERWVALYRIRVVDGRLLQRVVLRTPAALGLPLMQALGEEVWLWGDEWLLVLGVDPWEIRTWRDLRALVPSPTQNGTMRVAGTPYAWMWTEHRDGGRCRVVDMRDWRIERQFSPCEAILPVPGADPPYILRCLSPDGIHAHSPRGGKAPFAAMDCPPVQAAAPHPGRQGIVLLVIPPEDPVALHRPMLCLIDVEFHAGTPNTFNLIGTSTTQPCALATLPRSGVTYAVCHRTEQLSEVIRLRPTLQGVQEQDREMFSVGWCLVQSADGQAAALIGRGGDGFLFHPLDEQLPTLSASWRFKPPILPHITPPFGAIQDSEIQKRSGLYREALSRLPNIATWLDQHEEAVLEDAETAAQYGFALTMLEEHALARRILTVAWERHPGHPWVGLAVAIRHIDDLRWGEAIPPLTSIRLDQLPEGPRKHAYHLLGMASLHHGEPLAARDAWGGAMRLDGDPLIQELIDYAEELAEVGDGTERRNGLILLLRAIRDVDRRMAFGDFAGAEALLRSPLFWGMMEMQSAARIAACWLAQETTTTEDRYWKRIALARFMYFRQRKDISDIPRLPLGSATWREERLQELEQAAEAWLAEPPPLDERG